MKKQFLCVVGLCVAFSLIADDQQAQPALRRRRVFCMPQLPIVGEAGAYGSSSTMSSFSERSTDSCSSESSSSSDDEGRIGHTVNQDREWFMEFAYPLYQISHGMQGVYYKMKRATDGGDGALKFHVKGLQSGHQKTWLVKIKDVTHALAQRRQRDEGRCVTCKSSSSVHASSRDESLSEEEECIPCARSGGCVICKEESSSSRNDSEDIPDDEQPAKKRSNQQE